MTKKGTTLLWATDNTREKLIQLAKSRNNTFNLQTCDDIKELYYEIFSKKKRQIGVIIETKLSPSDANGLLECISNHNLSVPIYLISDTVEDFKDDFIQLKDHCFLSTEIELKALLNQLEKTTKNNARRIKSRKYPETEKSLVHLQESYERLVNGAGEGIVGLDKEGIITFANPVAAKLLSLSASEVIGRKFSDFSADSPLPLSANYKLESKSKSPLSRIRRGIIKNHNKGRIHVEYTLSYIGRSNDPTVNVMVIEDITERVEFEEKLKRIATVDNLTGIFNRFYYENVLNQELSNRRNTTAQMTQLLVDVDNFKGINDHYGHLVGDKVLIDIAKRLKQQVRREDLVARLGGDEFVVLIKDICAADAEKLAKKITESMQEPIIVLDKPLKVSISVGVHHIDPERDSVQSAINKSDRAMYLVKQSDKNGLAVYDHLLEQKGWGQLGNLQDSYIDITMTH